LKLVTRSMTSDRTVRHGTDCLAREPRIISFDLGYCGLQSFYCGSTESARPENDGPRKKTISGNCNTWKVKDQIAPCHLNIIITHEAATAFNGVFRIREEGCQGQHEEREPITGVRGRSPPSVAETLFAFERSMEAANSPIFHTYLRCFSKTLSLASCKTSSRINVSYKNGNKLHNTHSRPTHTIINVK